MSEIVAFDIYRTEALMLNHERITVYFSTERGTQEHVLFAVNDAHDQGWRGSCTPEVAADIAKMTRQERENAVRAILQQG